MTKEHQTRAISVTEIASFASKLASKDIMLLSFHQPNRREVQVQKKNDDCATQAQAGRHQAGGSGSFILQ
jgi:hypothetical protein